MIFNSFKFLIFFSLVFVIYYLVPKKARTGVLLVSSYIFYMCYKPSYVFLLMAITLVCYSTAILLEKYKKYRRYILGTGLALILGTLVFFKYTNFIFEIINSLSAEFSFLPDLNLPPLNILVPLGISFQVFQNSGYVIDVFLGRIEAEKNLLYYSVFAAYFPTILSGPIERATNLLPQIHSLQNKSNFEYGQVTDGLRLILIGLIKKVAVADVIAVYVNAVYDEPTVYTGIPLILATLLYSLQIYCDFSGYSDMATGISKMLGINLMRNFDTPYLSKSMAEFWRRWHISLSTWFRDNVYIPLGGNRVSLSRHLFNLLITFIVSGIWHGANGTFFIWGTLHGFFLCVGVLKKKYLKKQHTRDTTVMTICRIICVYLLTSFAWIFFRANSISDAVYIVTNLFNISSVSIGTIRTAVGSLGFTIPTLILSITLIVLLVLIDIVSYNKEIERQISSLSIIKRWVLYIVFTFVIIIGMMVAVDAQTFIYFQF